MRAWVTACLLGGCLPAQPPAGSGGCEPCATTVADADADADADTDADTDTDTDTDTDADTDTPATLAATGRITCPEPDARARLGAFERRVAPGPPTDRADLVGGAVVVADLTGDGRADIFLPGEAPTPQLHVQGPGVSFDEQGASRFPGIDLSQASDASVADFDGDGDLDLFVGRWERPNVLLENDGTGTFSDVTHGSSLGWTAFKSVASTWADMDGDGDLDLAVGGYGPAPEDHLEMTAPADPLELYRGNGDGTFDDESHLVPLHVHDSHQFQLAWLDLDVDGFPELLSVHDFGRVPTRGSVLLYNRGGVTLEQDVQSDFHPDFEGMGLGIGDVNGDGAPDFLESSWQTAALLTSRASADSLTGLAWLDSAAARGLEVDISGGCYGFGDDAPDQCYGWGSELGDIDNDGDLDAWMTFGFWSTYGAVRRYEHDALWLQDADGQFAQVGSDPFWDIDDDGANRGLVLADVNDDGWLDAVVRSLEGDTPLFLSRCGEASWLRVRLQEARNTHGVGGTVVVEVDGERQTRWITAGGTSLFSAGPPEAHFGLGTHEQVDRVEIIWPDGRRDTFADVDTRQIITVTR